MVFKNKLTFLNDEKKPVLDIELGIFKLDKIDELKTFILGLKEDASITDVKSGISNLYEGNELTKFSTFDGLRATLQAEKIEDPKLGNISNEKLDTQSEEIATMQEHLEIIRFKEGDDKPDLKKNFSEDNKKDVTEEVKDAKEKEPEEKVVKDVGIDKSIFLKESPVSDSFKKLHKDGFKNLNNERSAATEATGEASNKNAAEDESEKIDNKEDSDVVDEEKDSLKKGNKDGRN